jgi:hypothetical protein
MKIRYLLYLLVLLLCLPHVAASFDNTPMAGVGANFTSSIGNDLMESFVNIPVTMEDVAFPVALFYILMVLAFGILLFGIWFATRPEYIPANGIISCGILAMGLFFALAMMSPYVSTTTVTQLIVPTTGSSGSITLNATNTLYLTTVNVYQFSSWVAYMMWGGGVAGLVEAILGALAYLGWFHRKGLKNAQKGKYVETDVEDDEPQKMFNQ